MKAISLWQPWATLVMLGLKRIETRSWSTPHRGLLLVHASAKTSNALVELCHEEPFRSALRGAGFERWQSLPRGCALGLVELVDCRMIVDVACVPSPADLLRKGGPMLAPAVEDPEYSFGDYTHGRFGWLLKDPKPFAKPYPLRGRQGLFSVSPQELGFS